ncbi:uncharacterized protein B0H18DRAFT_996245 [Fomitopsis serialis]|uniref:uncharacterized protein n=1 Tax=Fomitopsis serialis TaxID=139415 RepID=UPI002007EC56|nr:uncharacterized protein B0H18DRAFT_996245 [Neoantrodia serialis]KAH9929781.1 hypothetical protein B0H18DRAFT_996245 [Neoantrodia serialis]
MPPTFKRYILKTFNKHEPLSPQAQHRAMNPPKNRHGYICKCPRPRTLPSSVLRSHVDTHEAANCNKQGFQRKGSKA